MRGVAIGVLATWGMVVSTPAHAGLPICADGTYWDGIVCAHPRATCGAWDGTSCDSRQLPGGTDAQARAQYALIDAAARALCPEDDPPRQVFEGPVGDVVKATDRALGEAIALDKQLERLRQDHPSPSWRVATLARAGSIFDCIWTSLRASLPTYFTAQQQAMLQKMQGIVGQLSPAQSAGVSAGVQAISQAVREKWRSVRDQYLAALAPLMVQRYVSAAILARRYALEGYWLTRASERLPVIEGLLGTERMAALVNETSDPTDPEPDPANQRKLQYVAGAFANGP